MNTENLIQKLNELYGEGSGMKVYMTIMPGILSDFQKMLASSPIGETVTEEYRLENGKGIIVLTGKRDASGNVSMNAELR